MLESELSFYSIEQIATLYRTGKLSPIQLTELYLRRIETFNSRLNAFITVTSAEAISQAQQAERELHAGQDRGMLHGIPIALKDLIDTAQIRTTAASPLLRERIPVQDAPIVQNLRAAGAVILGKTNMTEFAMGVVHPDFGQTNNPWDTGRTAGSSSGGSAAAVAAGLCCAAVGSDTGGSIRIPASYCGLAGLKPTHGLVDTNGVVPLAPSLDHVGPLARSSRDAALLLLALAGKPTLPIQPVELFDQTLGVIQYPTGLLQPEVEVAFTETLERLRAAGFRLIELSLPGPREVDQALFNTLLPEAATVHEHWIHTQPEQYAPLTLQQFKQGFDISAVAYLQAQAYRVQLRERYTAALQSCTALISPTVPFVAPTSDPLWHSPEGEIEGYFTVAHNLTGFPALSICAGWVGDLPVGMQVITLPHTDEDCLMLGAALETLLEHFS